MKYFKPEEFHEWFDYVSPKLLAKLDTFRELWGAPVFISRASGAVGRQLGKHNTSQHNIDHWGEVRAVDVMPDGMETREDVERAVQLATIAGFTGIGLYPHWRPLPGLHLDVRDGKLATWGGVKSSSGKQVYVSLNEAIAKLTAEV